MGRIVSGVLAAVFLCVAAPASAQQWDTYTNDDFDIQFSLPGRWEVETKTEDGVPTLLGTSSDGTLSLFVLSFKDTTLSTEELFDQAVETLDMDVDGDAEEGELNGMHVWVGAGAGKVKGDRVGLAVQAMTYDENNHVVYVFTNIDSFKRNAPTMDKILESFKPLK